MSRRQADRVALTHTRPPGAIWPTALLCAGGLVILAGVVLLGALWP